MQLFLTDFSNMYVCRVESVSEERGEIPAPEYYAQMEVERWFVITDIREIVRGDFGYVRDRILVGLTTPNYGNHTYALYGNRYDYPLEVKQKEPIDYFEEYTEGVRHFVQVFKGDKYTQIQKDLKTYIFGEQLLYSMHPDSLDAIIEAEVQYDRHRENALYDFAAIVILYAKVFENESYYFLRKVFEQLMCYDQTLETLSYQVQGRGFCLVDYLSIKPNMGTNKYLLSKKEIYEAHKACFAKSPMRNELFALLVYKIKDAITTIQTIRNEASHGGCISKQECEQIRALILGVGRESILTTLLRLKQEI
jgi:hypothetical protein